jgi:hypothetical protein
MVREGYPMSYKTSKNRLLTDEQIEEERQRINRYFGGICYSKRLTPYIDAELLPEDGTIWLPAGFQLIPKGREKDRPIV